ncbi:phytoene/squalene synthase family protein [Flaviflagellibacter deserti]|uniref:Phytoene/squalene synthase family protein n=1 Tax=Flaviflagellibacter deserti TaxID=2267266 RepID=A0ABV9Z555_9HYPH
MMDTAAYCQELVRDEDRDRFLTTLFAPDERRQALYALYAFNTELARVRESVSDPIPGEIRLTWWREVFEGSRKGEAEAHPVARALLSAIHDNRLPFEPFIRMTEARVFDLYDDPVPTVGDLEGYAGDTSSALIRLASIVLTGGEEPGGAAAAGHAGVAYAITGLLRAFPFHAQRGQIFVPAEVLARNGVGREDVLSGRTTPEILAALKEMRELAWRHLDAARAAMTGVDGQALAAFLPGALVAGYLKRMERRDYDPFRTPVEVPQWRRQWTLWRAASRSRPLG